MLPRAVLTQLKAGVRAAARPDPVRIGWWAQPARVGDAPEAGEAVGDDGALRRDGAPRQRRDRLAPEARHPAQLQADRLALRRGLDRGDDRCLAGRAAAALAAR